MTSRLLATKQANPFTVQGEVAMTKEVLTLQFSEFGAPHVLRPEYLPCARPKPGEIQIQHLAIGVNFIDIYHRKGVFAAPLTLPSGLGVEGVGIVTEVGEGVTGIAAGQRVAYAGGPPGSYSTMRNLPAARAIVVPDGLDSIAVAALMFKGLTVEYLIHKCAPVSKDSTVLFHAAAGGVGSIACQWLRQKGVKVIGTTSSDEKAAIARANGCEHVITYIGEDFQTRVAELTGGRGVDVVYDSVGADTFVKSLSCLRPRGTMVSFGESSGPVPALNVADLGAKGSLYVTRPSIAHYTANRSEYEAAAVNLFTAIADGIVKCPDVRTYPLESAQKAHEDIESRRTTGSVVLVP